MVGQVVEITEGPFSDFSGTVEEVLADKGKVRCRSACSAGRRLSSWITCSCGGTRRRSSVATSRPCD